MEHLWDIYETSIMNVSFLLLYETLHNTEADTILNAPILLKKAQTQRIHGASSGHLWNTGGRVQRKRAPQNEAPSWS